MISSFFTTAIYDPLYNGLIFLVSIAPLHDVGIAIVLLTIIVRLILFPLAQKSIKAQVVMKKVEPELKNIREKYKKDKQEQAKQTMALYKEQNINPISGILLLLIQLPIIFGLYWVFFKGGLPVVDTSRLYSFLTAPTEANMQFLGLIDMAGRSILLAFLAGGTQFIHARIAFAKNATPRPKNPTMKDDLAHSMQLQMRYVLPIIIGVIAYTISAAVALYWAASNTFTIFQELYVRRKLRIQEEKNGTESKDNN
ncbi:hypothetical protein COU17_03630 [Candidatus Kaiserbacteria bacterium CG10_big_fil_rev_8_21_14_0_10_49_17]|uniref:Membrane insertase YidC/Oxa/ALB C-terminal domain-containing protein n=1 Tax=Candidatus Kaiserbacteria bacterium CG10_big_fil_rev_8_21_14_0_10_49_17 TaxID=1974609 RepID=A0A2M6WDJ7_9BACT|nr:MAG: hypothetical protein COU17_03630 [Candidatus Kaiserbacteria bacterium CG10_big_fil_rev_8_21_14_0_10_49_17]